MIRQLTIALLMSASVWTPIGWGQVAEKPKRLFENVAIITPLGTKEPLVDLLTAKLSDEGFALVARGAGLDLISDESKLSGRLSSKQAIEIGGLIKADVLVILKREDTLLDVIFVETQMGTQLGRIVVPGTDLEKEVALVAQESKRLKKKFAKGIKTIVAIPPFASENFQRDYDELQTSISRYLEARIQQQPGIAVVEFGEAKEILKENQLTGTQVQRRIPIIVSGRFKVTPDSDPSITLEVRVSSNQAKSIKGTIALRELRPWLEDNLMAEVGIDSLNGSLKAISADQQIDQFQRYATNFARLGDYLRSTSIREAQLLLEPTNKSLRKQLTLEYQQIMLYHSPKVAQLRQASKRERSAYQRSARNPKGATQAKRPRRLTNHDFDRAYLNADYKVLAMNQIMIHLEYLARNGYFQNRRQLQEALFRITTLRTFYGTMIHSIPVPESIRKRHARFLVLIAKTWNQLPDALDEKKPTQFFNPAEKTFWEVLLYTMAFHVQLVSGDPHEEVLPMHAELLTLYPKHQMPIGPMMFSREQLAILLQIPEAKLNQYFDRLAASDHDVARFCGAVNELQVLTTRASQIKIIRPAQSTNRLRPANLPQPKELSSSSKLRLNAALQRLSQTVPTIRQLVSSDQPTPTWNGRRYPHRKESFKVLARKYDHVLKLVDQYQPGRGYVRRFGGLDTLTVKETNAREKRNEVEKDGIVLLNGVEYIRKTDKRGRVSYYRKPDIMASETGRFKAEPLKVTIDGALQPKQHESSMGIAGMLNCGTFDFLWTEDRLFVMKRKGIVEEIRVPKAKSRTNYEGEITSPEFCLRHSVTHPLIASYDGMYVWISGAATNRIQLLDAATKKVSDVGGLPNADRMQAVSYGPGKAVIVGSTLPNARAWIALVDVNESVAHPLVDVIHEAKEVPTGTETDKRTPSIQLAFHPGNTFNFDQTAGREKVMIIRLPSQSAKVASRELNPLVVDIQKRTISTYPTRVLGFLSESVFVKDRELFAVNSDRSMLHQVASDGTVKSKSVDMKNRKAARFGNWIYTCQFDGSVVGSQIARFNLENHRLELLSSQQDVVGHHCCSSAHYGLVAIGYLKEQPKRTPEQAIAFPMLKIEILE